MSEEKPVFKSDRELAYYKQFIKDGKVDVQSAKAVGGLNDAQIPLLTDALVAAGFIKEEKAEDVKKEEPKTTKPLSPVVAPSQPASE